MAEKSRLINFKFIMAKRSKKTLAAVLAAGASTVIAADLAFNTAYEGEVLRIIDADTQEVRIMVLPALEFSMVFDVRALGIDTPEKRRPDKSCHDGGIKEKNLAIAASNYVGKLISPGSHIRITNVGLGKYAGRMLGNVWFQQGDDQWRSLSQDLIDRNFAVEYWGGTKQSWCSFVRSSSN